MAGLAEIREADAPAEISDEEARAYWAARDRAGGEATDEKALCRARARGAIAPVERTELGLAKDQRVVVLRAELAATGWVFAAAYDGASGYVPRSYLKPVSAAPAAAAEPGAARRAKAFADFEAEARARYLEEFSRLATTDDVIGYAWPKPELGPDGLPLPLAARGGAATAPVPERTADEEPALLGSHDRRRAHAETRRRALAAKRRGVFRPARWRQQDGSGAAAGGSTTAPARRGGSRRRSLCGGSPARAAALASRCSATRFTPSHPTSGKE